MKTKGKAWQLVVTALLIVVFVYTAFFGVAAKYGDVTTTYIKGAKDIRFGVDIKGGVNVTFVPSDGYDATDEQLDAARLVIENRLVALNVTDNEVANNAKTISYFCVQQKSHHFCRPKKVLFSPIYAAYLR